MRPIACSAAVLLLVSLSVDASHLRPNDAGTGADAGNSEAQATLLPGFGTFSGALDPPTDADWYRILTTDAKNRVLCTEATAHGEILGLMTLKAISSTGTKTVRSVLADSRPARGAVALNTDQSVVIGIEPFGPSTSYMGAAFGHYSFNTRAITLLDLSSGDGGTNRDAGATTATAIPVQPGCVGGRINMAVPGRGRDVEDRYTFESVAGHAIALSLVNEPLALARSQIEMRLIAPDGRPVVTVSPSELKVVDLQLSGTWTLQVVPTGDPPVNQTPAAYVIGLMDEGPDTQPCRPACR